MHVCEDFRERITEQLLGHCDFDNNVEVQRELLVCNRCADFYAESKEMVEALSSVHFDVPEDQWSAMADRMGARIRQEYATRQHSGWRAWFKQPSFTARTYLPAFAGAAAMLVLTVGLYWLSPPLVLRTPEVTMNAPTSAIVDPGVNPDPSLDPITLEYLEQSELLLRSVMKLEPTSVEDVEEAKIMADRQLIALDQRRHAAVELPPVVTAMNKYEDILRDIRNLDRRFAADDIADIRKRIGKTGLIADIKSFQPRISLVEADLGLD